MKPPLEEPRTDAPPSKPTRSEEAYRIIEEYVNDLRGDHQEAAQRRIRRADVIGAAVMIGRIATAKIDDLTTEDGKNAAAGRMAGKARPLRKPPKHQADGDIS